MKKTLFLSAIFGAALSSSASAETVVVNGQTYENTTVITSVPTAQPTDPYVLVATNTVKAQNNTDKSTSWAGKIGEDQTIIVAPAEGKTMGTLFFDTGDNGNIVVHAGIIAGGSTSTNALRFWSGHGHTITLNGELTALDTLKIKNESSATFAGHIAAEKATIDLSGQTATVTKNANAGVSNPAGANYNAGHDGFTITNAVVTMTNDTLKNKLLNSDLVGKNSNLAVTLQSEYSLNNVTAHESIKFLQAGESSVMESLTLNNGADVNSYDTDATSAAATLTTTTLTVNATGSALNGGLTVNGSDAMITFADGAVLTLGGAVTIGDAVTVVLSDEMVSAIAEGGHVELFTGATALTQGEGIKFVSGSATPLEQPGVYALSYDETTQTVYVSPEPATATLSLLALAGLAARRRRR